MLLLLCWDQSGAQLRPSASKLERSPIFGPCTKIIWISDKNVPLRLILSMCGSIYNKTTAKLTQWILVVPQANIKFICKWSLKTNKRCWTREDDIRISFYVTSSCTNVQDEQSINAAAHLLYSGNPTLPPKEEETFIKLWTLRLKDVLMSTVDGYYRQTVCIAMGHLYLYSSLTFVCLNLSFGS